MYIFRDRTIGYSDCLAEADRYCGLVTADICGFISDTGYVVFIVMMKKIVSILRKPYLMLAFFLVSVIMTSVSGFSGVCLYQPLTGYKYDGHIGSGSIRYFDVTDEGRMALNVKIGSGYGFIGNADIASGKLAYMVDGGVLADYCGGYSRFDVIGGDDCDTWLHYVRWTENNAAVISDGILKISSDGRSVAMFGGLGYSELDDPPTREPRLSAFSYGNGMLRFAYSDMSGAKFYSISGTEGVQTLTGSFLPEEGTFVGRVFALDNGFLLAMSDGSVYRTGFDASERELVFSAVTDISDCVNSCHIKAAAELDGKLYVTAGVMNDTLYLLENSELTPVAETIQLGEEGLGIKQLKAAAGKIYLNLDDRIAVYDGSTLSVVDTAFEMPFINAFMTGLSELSSVFLLISLILLIVYFVFVKKTLLTKQLLLTVPTMLVICVLVCEQAGAQIVEAYVEQQDNAAIAICDITAGFIDGDLIAEMTDGGEWDISQYNELRDTLLKTLDGNMEYWSDVYDLRLCAPDDNGEAMIVADSRRIAVPFADADEDIDLSQLEEYISDETSDVSVFNITLEDNDRNYILPKYGADVIIAVAPVYTSDDEISAYLILSTDEFSLQGTQLTLISIILQAIAPYMVILVVLISVISAVLSLRIRKATKTVIKIADGDLSARINNRSGDELGEICCQVNTMASNLEVIFDEKDKNEQFYYKFVPEKFCELLGKEKITDLALGDAESREFTVLFCDIRSFSINSEMLTAKENFEFVNVIYGIAGPIIREYGGFVDKYIGDAVMALFESPDAAVQAGIRLYHDIVIQPETAHKLNVRDINIGIGIHTGMARIGIVGEDERLSGTVISDTVNISSRLESLTKAYHTAMLISKDTVDRMKDPDSLNKRYVGMVQVAGVNDVNALYEVLDCLGDEERAKRTANKEDFKEAVRLFHLGRRNEAAQLLDDLRSSGRSDDVTEMYREYIENMSSEDKGNVFRFVRK